MKKHSSTIEVWPHEAWGFPGAWLLELDAFAISYFLAFLILIPVPVVSPGYAPQDEASPLCRIGFKPVLKGFKVI
jgi:hypothetical protein